MLNALLMSVYNLADLPLQATTYSGDILLEAGYQPYAYTPDEQPFDQLVFADCASDYQRFGRCLQLVNLLQASAYAGVVTAVDDRITYTRANISEHIQASSVPPPAAQLFAYMATDSAQKVAAAMSGGPAGLGQSTLDRAAVLIAYFGRRAWL